MALPKNYIGFAILIGLFLLTIPLSFLVKQKNEGIEKSIRQSTLMNPDDAQSAVQAVVQMPYARTYEWTSDKALEFSHDATIVFALPELVCSNQCEDLKELAKVKYELDISRCSSLSGQDLELYSYTQPEGTDKRARLSLVRDQSHQHYFVKVSRI